MYIIYRRIYNISMRVHVFTVFSYFLTFSHSLLLAVFLSHSVRPLYITFAPFSFTVYIYIFIYILYYILNY